MHQSVAININATDCFVNGKECVCSVKTVGNIIDMCQSALVKRVKWANFGEILPHGLRTLNWMRLSIKLSEVLSATGKEGESWPWSLAHLNITEN